MKTAEKIATAGQPATALLNATSTRLVSAKIQPAHLERLAIVYVRQSSPTAGPGDIANPRRGSMPLPSRRWPSAGRVSAS